MGNEAGTAAEFQNAGSQLSAHFSVGLDGRATQYVQLGDAAWANGGPNPGWRWPFGDENPNLRTISIETEDNGQPDTQPVTDEQYATVLALARLGMERWSGITHLVAHRVINPAHSCPGARWLDSGRFAQLGADLGLTVLT